MSHTLFSFKKPLRKGFLTKNDSIFVIPANAQLLLKKNLVKLYPSNWQSNFLFVAQWFPSVFQTKTSKTLVVEKISQNFFSKRSAITGLAMSPFFAAARAGAE